MVPPTFKKNNFWIDHWCTLSVSMLFQCFIHVFLASDFNSSFCSWIRHDELIVGKNLDITVSPTPSTTHNKCLNVALLKNTWIPLSISFLFCNYTYREQIELILSHTKTRGCRDHSINTYFDLQLPWPNKIITRSGRRTF